MTAQLSSLLFRTLGQIVCLSFKMFVVVRKKSAFEAIPASFVVTSSDGSEIVWWPKKNVRQKIQNANCIPDVNDVSEWFPSKEIVVKRNYETWAEANAEADRLLEATTSESEDDRSIQRLTRRTAHTHKASVPTVIPKFNVPPSKLSTPNATVFEKVRRFIFLEKFFSWLLCQFFR